MTLLVSWVSKDDKPQGKETSALYIGADSRYSWSSVLKKYDSGPKTYACQNSPDMFGFCGDVAFCIVVISQLKNLIDSRCLFRDTDDIEEKTAKVRDYIHSSVKSYPQGEIADFTILHGSRAGNDFALNSFSYSCKSGFSYNREEMPEVSNKVTVKGSGSSEFWSNWMQADKESNNNSHTSRNIFHCLNYTIKNAKDKATGGCPQIVGIYFRSRHWNSKVIN